MKISKIIFLMAATSIGFFSCQKNEVADNITGDWEGKWGFGNEVPAFYEKWELEKDGDLSAFFPDGSLYATGSWEMDGDDFEAQYTLIGQTYGYTFSGFCNGDEIEGTWGETPSAIDGGTFEMFKQ